MTSVQTRGGTSKEYVVLESQLTGGTFHHGQGSDRSLGNKLNKEGR